MTGVFGYEKVHYDLSMKIGELSLIPAVREAQSSQLAACGISCKTQIEDGTGHSVKHPISMVAEICGT